MAKTLLLPLNNFRSFITKLLSVGRSAHRYTNTQVTGDMCDTCHLQESMAEGLTHVLRGCHTQSHTEHISNAATGMELSL